MKSWIHSRRAGVLQAPAILFLAALFLAPPPAPAQFSEGTGAGTALLFDGVSGYVSVSNSPALNLFPLTIMGWFRSFDQGLDRALVDKYVANSFNGYLVYLHQGHLRAWYFRDGSNFVWDGGRGLDGGFVAGLWQHFAFTVDATGGKLYVNGQLRASQPWTGTPGATTTAQEMRFGRYDNSFFNGELDEVSVWNVSLSPSAIANTMNRRILNNETGLMGYWRFSEGSGILAADAAPAAAAGNNLGTLFGGVTWVPSGGGVGPFVNTRGISGQTVAGNVSLNGEVNPLGRPTTAWFEWGTNTGYGNLTTPVNVGSSSNYLTAGALLSGLQQGRTYHYRYVATNLNGRANGADQNFTQPIYPGPGGTPPLRSSAYDGAFASTVAFDPRPDWDRSAAMTLEAWVYRRDAARFETVVSHDWPGSYWFGFSPKMRFYRGTNFAEVPNIIPALKWTHVAVSYDGAVARFYINGDFVGARTVANTGAGKLRALQLGFNDPHNIDISPRDTFSGNLDEVRLWSVARSAEEIRDGLYREVRGEPQLAAVFPRGGRFEEISGLVGAVGSGVTEQIVGMVPRDLVVPRAAFPPTADGTINFATEYLGADQLVLRYPDQPTVPDTTAHFVHTDNDLFVAVTAIYHDPVLGVPPSAWMSLFVDTTNAKPPVPQYPQIEIRALTDGDTNHTGLLNGDGVGSFYACFTPPGIGLPQPCTPRALWQVGERYCNGEINPDLCLEYRVSRVLLGSFDEFDGVALGHFNFTPFGDQTFVPEDGFPEAPVTWLTMSYGQGSANLPRVRWSGRVYSGLNSNNAVSLPGYRVSLIANSVGYTQLTDFSGRFNFDVPMPTGEVMFAQAELEAFGRYTLPRVYANGIAPQFVDTNRVIFPRLPANVSTNAQLASVDFFVQQALGPSAIFYASPTNPMCGTSVRQGVPGGPGEIVTIYGTNLHAEMDFCLAPVSSTFPTSPAAWTLLRAELIEIAPDRRSAKVRTPFVPEYVREFQPTGVFIPSFTSPWRWVSQDHWFRPGAPEYSYFGPFGIRRPPYPLVHGFNFENDQTIPGYEEFLAAYGANAYICVGAFGHCATYVPDPLYWILWFPVHFIVIAKSGGSCVGFSGTAMQLYSGTLLAPDFDPQAITALGIDDAPGLPGKWDTSNTGGMYTRPPIPKDIWARIRMNHCTQTSSEYMLHALSQLDDFEGSPVARLPGLRAGTTAQAVCMVRGLDGGHCVAPYQVQDNPDGTNANITRVWIYDNEAPCALTNDAMADCVVNQYIDIDRAADEYHYHRGGWVGTGFFTMPLSLYNGSHHAPGVDSILEAAGWLIALALGDADARITAPGREWGFRADGSFTNNFPGVQSLPILGSTTNSTRSVPILISNSIPLTNLAITANVRGTNHSLFHIASGGTLLQMDILSSPGAHSNVFTLGLHSNKLASFRFRPQVAHSNLIARVGFALSNNACATFQWMGLQSEAGRVQEFRARKDRRAVEFCNETTHSNTYYLRIDAVDGASSNNACNVFGPFSVPTGAVHCVVLNDWPRARTVRSELDFNGDGIPDVVTDVTGVEIDSDGDGMPDAWETMHKLDPTSALCDDGPDADPDGDGVSNLGEYLSDTDPHDPNSALRLTATRLPGNKVRLSWKAVPGRRYEIQYANTFEFVFQPLAASGPRVATSTEEHFDDVLPSGTLRSRFYRLRLVP